jgi:hypothetical protein
MSLQQFKGHKHLFREPSLKETIARAYQERRNLRDLSGKRVNEFGLIFRERIFWGMFEKRDR